MGRPTSLLHHNPNLIPTPYANANLMLTLVLTLPSLTSIFLAQDFCSSIRVRVRARARVRVRVRVRARARVRTRGSVLFTGKASVLFCRRW